MKEQIYQIDNITTFNLEHIFECGQCFRWNQEQNDGGRSRSVSNQKESASHESEKSYIGVFGNNVLKVKQRGSTVIFEGICEGNIEETVKQYFDLERDYEKIKRDLSKVDEPLKNSIRYGTGIRLLNQDLWETIISFIISANNNIPRIKGIIERLSKQYGKPMEWNGKTYYTFPMPRELAKANVQDLRNLGLGFRDQRVYETTKMILNKQVDLEKLKRLAKGTIEKQKKETIKNDKKETIANTQKENEKNTAKIREILLTLPGVGPKVADCIMLFSTLKCLEVFPVDVWVRRVMNELYFRLPEENKLKNKQIEILAKEKYGDLAGIAQQYLFYWKREA